MTVMAVVEPHDEDHETLRDVARVHAISREIQEALSALAVRPLDEARAVQMMRVLGSPAIDEARTALSRLHLVRDPEPGSSDDAGEER